MLYSKTLLSLFLITILQIHLKAVPKKENNIFIQNFKDHNMNLYNMLQ